MAVKVEMIVGWIVDNYFSRKAVTLERNFLH
jgi:hypothetical protein